MTTVLVTGSNGQLGKTIEELYADNNLGVAFEFVTKTELDITIDDKVVSFFKKIGELNESDFVLMIL